ncbi:hypothetical protein Hypma_008369, partial [Hypsizygus marmoreus]
SRRAWKGH